MEWSDTVALISNPADAYLLAQRNQGGRRAFRESRGRRDQVSHQALNVLFFFSFVIQLKRRRAASRPKSRRGEARR
jgi:hypothetical protein